MAVDLDNVGIQSYSAASLCESVEYEQSVDEVMIPNCDSQFGAAETFDPKVTYSAKGFGTLPAGLVLGVGTGVGTDGVTDADIAGVNTGSGTSIVTNVKYSEKNDGFDAWEMSGSYWPGAV